MEDDGLLDGDGLLEDVGGSARLAEEGDRSFRLSSLTLSFVASRPGEVSRDSRVSCISAVTGDPTIVVASAGVLGITGNRGGLSATEVFEADRASFKAGWLDGASEALDRRLSRRQ